jgi:hypothetical protein
MGGPAEDHGVEVRCEPAGRASVDVRIANRSGAAVHLLDGARMPYLIREAGGTLLVLFGVNAPDPELDYFGIEIPVTRPLGRGDSIRHRVELSPLELHDHYQAERSPTELHGTVQVRCEVGWTEQPIADEDRPRLSITALIERQHLAAAEPVPVEFG